MRSSLIDKTKDDHEDVYKIEGYFVFMVIAVLVGIGFVFGLLVGWLLG